LAKEKAMSPLYEEMIAAVPSVSRGATPAT
jgi:hypothetical protein